MNWLQQALTGPDNQAVAIGRLIGSATQYRVSFANGSTAQSVFRLASAFTGA